jgi:AraC-like DNA-binding protein
LKENFSSQDVLTHFDLPRNKLDELLIHVKGITFAEWLNSFRINYAKTLLISNKEFTIDAISVMAGFSSRSAFYAAFKHLTKTTPTEFIRQTRKEIEEK